MPRLLSAFLGICLVLSISLGGCAPRGPKKATGGELRIGIFHKPTEINPLTTDSSISANLLVLLFDRMIHLSGNGDVKPELAERWEISPDRLTWTFHLRDVRFHDGSPLTADDVKFTFDTILKTKSGGYSYTLKHVKEIRVPDPKTVQILLDRPDNLLWVGLGTFGIAPKRLLEDAAAFNRHPVGSGPYVFVKQDESEIVLAVNGAHFGGRPYLDRIVVKVFPSQAATLNNLIAENIDMAFLHNPEDYGALSSVPTIRLYNNWYPILHMLTFNLEKGLFADSEVRRALNLGVDSGRLIERVLKGKGVIAGSTVMPGSADFNPDVTPYSYRPDRALEILQGLGWSLRPGDHLLQKGGKPFEFSALTIEGLDMNSKILLLIQEQLRQIGIKMDIEAVPFDAYVRRVFREKNYDSNLVYMIFRPFFDFNYSFWHSSQIRDGLNYPHYANPDVDRFLDEARLAPDGEKRKSAYRSFQKAFHDDPPGILLFWREMPVAVHRRFHGVPEGRMEDLRDLVNVWESPPN